MMHLKCLRIEPGQTLEEANVSEHGYWYVERTLLHPDMSGAVLVILSRTNIDVTQDTDEHIVKLSEKLNVKIEPALED